MLLYIQTHLLYKFVQKLQTLHMRKAILNFNLCRQKIKNKKNISELLR